MPRLKYFFGTVPKKDFQIDGQLMTSEASIWKPTQFIEWTVFSGQFPVHEKKNKKMFEHIILLTVITWIAKKHSFLINWKFETSKNLLLKWNWRTKNKCCLKTKDFQKISKNWYKMEIKLVDRDRHLFDLSSKYFLPLSRRLKIVDLIWPNFLSNFDLIF